MEEPGWGHMGSPCGAFHARESAARTRCRATRNAPYWVGARPFRLGRLVNAGEETEPRASGDVQRNISRRLVALHKEFYGKGPKRAKAYYLDDMVVLLMRGGFSKVEETLLAEGRGEAVIRQRMEFQDAMLPRFTEVIESETGRSVVAFMSGSHQDPDISSEIFILETTDLLSDAQDDDAAPRSETGR
jgi:uncharacterized protein YbcI